MPINLPSNLYSGGAVVFDSQPIADMYTRFNQRQMARDEALDDYFRNLNKNINPAGMRNQDVEGLTSKSNEWNQFYVQNSKAIKNPKLDGGKALTEYQSRYQDMLNYINQSKNATKISADLAKAKLNPNLGYMFEDDEILNQIQEHDKPLTDPTHKLLNINELSIQPKPLDLKEIGAIQKNALAGLKPSEEVESIDVDPKTLDTITTVKKKYSPEDLQAIGNRWKSYYQLDRRVRSTADKNLLNAPNSGELSEIYRSVYGKPAETPADLLAAQGILNAQTEGVVQKRTAGSLEQKRLLEGIKQANRRQMVDYRAAAKQAGKVMDNLWLDEYINKALEESKTRPAASVNYPTGIQQQEKQIALDPVLSKALAKQGVEPDYVFITADGKFRPVFLEYANKKPVKDKEGNFVMDEVLSQPISREQVKLALSKATQTAKQREAEMQPKEETKPEDYRKKYNY